MNGDYRWIVKLVGEKPDFWDMNGVPHWFRLEPDEDYEPQFFGNIFCQSCGRVFRVFLVDLIYRVPGASGNLEKLLRIGQGRVPLPVLLAGKDEASGTLPASLPGDCASQHE